MNADDTASTIARGEVTGGRAAAQEGNSTSDSAQLVRTSLERIGGYAGRAAPLFRLHEMTERKSVDWEAIEREYRAGQLTVVEIGRQHGLSHTAINKRAKRDGWTRNLANRVRKEVSARLVSQVSPEAERAAIEPAVARGVQVVRSLGARASRCATAGASERTTPVKSLHIVPTSAKLVGCLLPSRHHLVFGNPTPQSLAGIAEAAERGQLVPAIGRIVPLSEAISAVVELERTGSPKGKLVIVPMR